MYDFELSEQIYQSIKQLPVFIGIKTLDSKLIASTDVGIKMVGYDNFYDLYGISDFELKCEACQFAKDFIGQDQHTVKRQAANFIYYGRYVDGQEGVLVASKTVYQPYPGHEKLLFCSGNFISDRIDSSCYLLFQSDHRRFGKGKISYAIDENLHDILSSKESECLFYIMRGLSAKQVAARLGISPRTVEVHIENIKRKLNCPTKNAVIELAINQGLAYVIPPGLMGKLNLE